MGLSPVRLAIHDPNPASIGFPAGNTRGKMLIGVGYSLVIFLFELVLISIWIGIAAPPKLLNEPLPFVIRRQLLKSLSLFVRDYVSNILVQPILISLFKLRLDVASLLRRILSSSFLREQERTWCK